MTYIISGFRSEGRVRIGRVGMRNLHARVLAGLGAVAVPGVPGGTGDANDPFGGIGGATEAQLKALVKAGLTFSSVRTETGLLNQEKYIYCKGSNSKFYKFKVTGSGLGKSTTDAAAIAWFNAVVNASKPPVKSLPPTTPTTPGSGVNVPIVFTPPSLPPNGLKAPILTAGAGGGDSGGIGVSPTMIVGGVAVFLVAGLLLKRGKKAAA